jgi:alpha-tubulin suppressor-like RCC1 family protein
LFLVGCGESGGESGSGSSSDAPRITGFDFQPEVEVIQPAVIDESKSEINVKIDYYLTKPFNSTNPTPIVTHTGVDYSPTGVISAFGTPVTYTVTAQDGATKDYQALVKRAIVVSNGNQLRDALSAIGDDNDLTQIDLLIANDITLSSSFAIPSAWSSKGIVIENYSANPSVTITGLIVDEGSATLKGVSAKGFVVPSSAPCLESVIPSEIVVKAVAVGHDHNLVLSADGKVYVAGRNGTGQVGMGDSGEGDFKIHPTFVENTDLSDKNIVDLVAGSQHSFAIAADGKIYATGWNGGGQLGLGDKTNRNTFELVASLDGKNITAMFANGSTSFALAADGKIYAAGGGNATGLGGSASPVFTEVASLSGKGIIDIAVGYTHSLALGADGKVYAAGANYEGQLGLGKWSFFGGDAKPTYSSFTLVTSLNGVIVKSIAAGWNHSVVLSADGKIYAAGDNRYGQLGLGDSGEDTNRFLFTHSTSLDDKNITAVFANAFQTFALTADGKIYATGFGSSGELGLGYDFKNGIFALAPSLEGVTIKTIAPGHDHALALDSDGKLYATGDNYFGQLGFGDKKNRYVFTPLEIKGTDAKIPCIRTISAGGYHSVALSDNGKVYVTGWNKYGQLGLGDKTNRNTFKPVTSLKDKNITAVATGEYHSFALTNDGKVYAAGGNSNGQLGLGDTTDRGVFELVTALEDKNVVAIVTGYFHSFALTDDGKVYAAGDNQYGRLGLGDTDWRLGFTLVTSLEGKNIKALSADGFHSFAIDSDGKVYAAGNNSFGQLGLGNWTETHVFKPVTSLEGKNIVAIEAGYWHSIALDSEGKVYTTGNKENGRLGVGDVFFHLKVFTPVTSLNDKNIVAISGHYHSLALSDDGKVYATGDNGFGQLGLGDDKINRDSFELVTSLEDRNISSISAASSNYHSLALDDNGNVYSAGLNQYGELGLGLNDYERRYVFEPVTLPSE